MCCAQAVVTNTVVLRGHYQTLPVALYGWTIASDDEHRPAPLGGELAYSFSWEAPESNTQAFAGEKHTPAPHVSIPAYAALQRPPCYKPLCSMAIARA